MERELETVLDLAATRASIECTAVDAGSRT